MKITDYVINEFESGKVLTLSDIYDSIINDMRKERDSKINPSSLKHTIRGIVRNLVRKGIVIRVKQGAYQKI